MIKLNSLQYNKVLDLSFNEEITMNPLKNNEIVLKKAKDFSTSFGFKNLKTFKFNKDGILALLLQLKGKISVSVGESEAIVQAAKTYRELGFDIEFIPLTKEGKIEYEKISKSDYIFISSYVMDTYVKTDLKKVKELSCAKIISNISATLKNDTSDIALLDTYKLTGYSLDSIILYNDEFEEAQISELCSTSIYQIEKSIKEKTFNIEYKNEFVETLNREFKENIFYFVQPNMCLEYTLHFGLKGIKAREIIRTLALDSIYVTNGEGCSLGFAKPSRILQEMGYEELESRWALSLDFSQDLSKEEIEKIVKIFAKKYRQIIALSA